MDEQSESQEQPIEEQETPVQHPQPHSLHHSDDHFPHKGTKNIMILTAIVAFVVIIGVVVYGVLNPPVEEVPLDLPAQVQQAAPVEEIVKGWEPRTNLTAEEFSYIPQNITENQTLTDKTLVAAPLDWKIVYEDNFEQGSTRWRGILERGAEQVQNATVRSGESAIILEKPNTNLVFDIGYAFHDGVFVCHFFDNMTDYQQTYCGVSVYPTPVMDSVVMAGVNTQKSREQYVIYLGEGEQSWIDSGVYRHRGWHKITFDARERINNIYIDDQFAGSTGNHSVWRYFQLIQDDDIPLLEPAIFDDALVGVTVKRR